MKFVTCIGATLGLSSISSVPLLVTMRAKYFLPGSNVTTLGAVRRVFHPAAFLSTLAAAIWASICATTLSVAPLTAFLVLVVAAVFTFSAAAANVTVATRTHMVRRTGPDTLPKRFMEQAPSRLEWESGPSRVAATTAQHAADYARLTSHALWWGECRWSRACEGARHGHAGGTVLPQTARPIPASRSAGGVPGVAQLREAVLGASAGRDAGDAAGSDGAAAHGERAVEAQEVPEPGAIAAAVGGVLLAEGQDATTPQWHGASAEVRRVIIHAALEAHGIGSRGLQSPYHNLAGDFYRDRAKGGAALHAIQMPIILDPPVATRHAHIHAARGPIANARLYVARRLDDALEMRRLD